MHWTLEGEVAIVTGASRGLGRAWADALAGAGARVLMLAEHTEELREAAQALAGQGRDVQAIEVDLSDDRAFADLFERLGRATGRVDVLVNNAAVLHRQPVERLTDAQWEETMAVNLRAPFRLVRGLLPCLRVQGGSIVNVSSRAATAGFADEAAYCASKFGIEGLTKALAEELRPDRISINTLTPGLRIKPTGVTEAEARALPEAQRVVWQDATRLAPAFLTLATLRGEVTGLRFDALRLSEAVMREGRPLAPARLTALAE